MTGKKLLLLTFLQWLFFTLLKIWLLGHQVFGSATLQNILFWLLLAAVSAALVRRFGIISYFEVIFILLFWILLDMFLDLLITTYFTGTDLFARPAYWYGFLAIILSVFIFHKKRHIHVRKELRAKHGHGHH